MLSPVLFEGIVHGLLFGDEAGRQAWGELADQQIGAQKGIQPADGMFIDLLGSGPDFFSLDGQPVLAKLGHGYPLGDIALQARLK